MSKNLEVVRKIRAFQQGKPISRREKKTIALVVPKQTFFLAFVRMGGESLPWGIIWGRSGEEAKLSVVADPWVRDDLADSLKEFEKSFSEMISHPSSTAEKSPGAFQVFLPNSSHLEMLQNISFRYMFAKRGEDTHKDDLNRLGRICNFLFLESQRPGQQIVHVLSDVLKEHFSFPADELRQGHLGFLLALLKTEGDLKARLAAGKIAEQKTIGISLSPEIEKDVLKDKMDNLRAEIKIGDVDKILLIKEQIKAVVTTELKERFAIMKSAHDYFLNDFRRVNKGALELLSISLKEITKYFAQEEKITAGGEEKSFFAGPKTDRDPISAAIGYNIYISDEERRTNLLAIDDVTIQDEMIASGDALYAKVTSVEVKDALSPTGRRIDEIIWTIECSEALPSRLREGNKVSPISNPKLVGEIISIELKDGKKIIELEMSPKGLSKDLSLVDTSVVFIQPASSADFLFNKIKMYNSQRRSAS